MSKLLDFVDDPPSVEEIKDFDLLSKKQCFILGMECAKFRLKLDEGNAFTMKVPKYCIGYLMLMRCAHDGNCLNMAVYPDADDENWQFIAMR